MMDDQSTLFDPEHPNQIDDDVRVVGRNHPDTAQAMQRKTMAKAGSWRRELYDMIRDRGEGGLTDYEVEDMTHRSHQSVSGARSTLKRDGWVRDSGLRRRNKFGNRVAVWVAVPEGAM